MSMKVTSSMREQQEGIYLDFMVNFVEKLKNFNELGFLRVVWIFTGLFEFEF